MEMGGELLREVAAEMEQRDGVGRLGTADDGPQLVGKLVEQFMLFLEWGND